MRLRRKLPRTALIVTLLLGGGYSILWLSLAGLVHRRATEELQALNSGEQIVICENLRKSGYPLRISLVCDKVEWFIPWQGMSLRLGAAVAGAPIYAPSWRTLSLEAPGYFDWADFGSVEALWHHLALNADFVNGTPQNLILAIEDLRLNLHQTAALPEDDWPVALSAKADFIRFQLEQTAQRQARADLSFEALHLTSTANPSLPEMTGKIKMDLSPDMRRGQVEEATIDFASGGGVMLAGDFSPSPAGRLNANLTLTIRQPTALLRTVRTILPPAQTSNLKSLFFALNAMPKNEQGELIIPLNINEGRVRAGFIPLGTLPSL